MLDQASILQQTAAHVKETLSGEGTGHDWWHIARVWKMAVFIGERENVDLFVVQLAALLHDIADWKFYGGDEEIGPRLARFWLEQLEVEEPIIAHVVAIIHGVSFKGAGEPSKITTREGMVVQDADRLDALGAIGIARAFAYGGHRGRELYNPTLPPEMNQTAEQYKASAGPTINHFYEKLLLLKDRMNTDTARQIAAERHRYMEQFLDEFYKEWNGQA